MEYNNLMRIALITGGVTGEKEVSIRSAENVQRTIDFAEVNTFIFPEDKDTFLSEHASYDIVIPVIHGIGGEDGSLQGFLKTLKVPYIFSDITAHAIGINKRLTKQIATSLDLTVIPETFPSELKFPLFAKPNCGGSSVASKLCISKEELDQLISSHPHIDFIFEEPIKGREFTVGIIEKSKETIPLPVIEIIPKGEFFDFENKYNPEKLATEVCPADISNELSKKLQTLALTIHQGIGAKHISRSDFIITPENKIYFLEINTIPGMTDTSLIPKMLKEVNISLRGLLEEWCLESLIPPNH